jgi:SAM-dependent methyltransferase
MVMNYFSLASAAERYARGRPYFHGLATARIAAVCGPVERGLDVACGTGLSTRALAEIARTVVGSDLSPGMLAHADPHPRVSYLIARAEALPLADASFDLITVCQAFHWFDQERFLAEAHRLLRPGGWLALYNDGTRGTMLGNVAYAKGTRSEYLGRSPAPPRADRWLSPDRARRSSFEPEAHEEFTHEETMTLEAWTRFLITQSNVIAATDAGSEDIATVADWIRDGLRPLFRSDRETFPFGCWIDVFRRAS